MDFILEKHYTPGELAQQWALSVDTIRRMFRDEPDILRIERPETRKKRGYESLRIPASVAQRVYIRNSKRMM